MRRIFCILLLLIFIFNSVFSAPKNGILKTGLVYQNWSIEKLDDPVSEATFPIEVIYQIQNNLNIQIKHFPTFSKYGSASLNGLSDFWVKSSYSFAGNRALACIGFSLPTGKTKLDSSEIVITRILSKNSFKFRMPVLGQGLTLNGGIMYAYPLNDKITLGGGLNFVYHHGYKFSKLSKLRYNPGEQFGLNIGLDYTILKNLNSNFDFIYNYYTKDKIDTDKIFSSGPKLSIRFGLQYKHSFGLFWTNAYFRIKGKNESWDGQTLVPDSTNSNNLQREVIFGARKKLNKTVVLFANLEIRSYIENDFMADYCDIFGIGFGCDLFLINDFTLSPDLIIYFGDGEFEYLNKSLNQTFSGIEFKINTKWNF